MIKNIMVGVADTSAQNQTPTIGDKKTTTKQVPSIPNAAKLLNSLRHLDYSCPSAICDIVDNSIDAGAEVIHIRLIAHGNKDIQRIEIWDNGSGMDFETLQEAMRLGSDTEKNPEYDLGRYGMGLVTASISIGKKLEVISLCDDEISSSIQDLDVIETHNSFLIDLQRSKNVKRFLSPLKKYTSQKIGNNELVRSGTCVVLEKIDRWEWTLLSASEKKISQELGQIFRKFINSGRKIFVNGNNVEPIDPILDYEPTLFVKEPININGGKIEISIYELKDYGREINLEKCINQMNQGIYVLRNNREIARAQTFGLWRKSDWTNTFRAELIYPGSLDDHVHIGFTKQRVSMQKNQMLSDKLRNIITPYLKQVRRNRQQQANDRRKKKEDYTDIEKHITQHASLLKTPKAEVEKRNARKGNKQDQNLEIGVTRNPRLNITSRRRHITMDSLKVKFKTLSLDKTGPLYSTDMERDVTIINWNIDHPFYLDFIIPNESSPDVLNPICYLIYALASAELRSGINTDSQNMIDNIRADLSQNLRVLMD